MVLFKKTIPFAIILLMFFVGTSENKIWLFYFSILIIAVGIYEGIVNIIQFSKAKIIDAKIVSFENLLSSLALII